jgi:hypothetical protein
MLTVLRRFSILMTMIGELYFLGIRPSPAVQLSVYTMIAGKLNQIKCLLHSLWWKLEKENVTGGWRRLHNVEFHNSSSSPIRRMGGAYGMHRRGDKSTQYFSWNIYKAEFTLRDVDISRTIILQQALRKGDVMLWSIFIWPKITVIWCRLVR